MSSLALKFTSLLIRTLAKPIANGIKSTAKERPAFRKACIGFAQGLHRADIAMRMRLLGDKNIRVRPLNDAKAIDSGAQFLSETFLFSVAGGLIVYEAVRQRNKEAARRESVNDDIRTLQDEIEWLKKKLEEKKIIIDGTYEPPPDVKPVILKLKHNEGGDANSIQSDNAKPK